MKQSRKESRKIRCLSGLCFKEFTRDSRNLNVKKRNRTEREQTKDL
ncbi:MAG: hypothetical protein J6T10_26285 [Methanobrevibacter sp.]|nr:hypothetical protein [Methanobrevibacter sp.]